LEQIEQLVEDTERLEDNSRMFHKGATSLKRAMRCRNIKLAVAIILLVCVLVFFIVVGACGGFTFPKCVSSASGNATRAAVAALLKKS